MKRAVRTQQVVAPRAREIDTGAKFAGSLILSLVGHAIAATMIVIGAWFVDEEEKTVAVGYKVELISLNPSKKSERTQAPPKTIEQAPAPKPFAAPEKPAQPVKVEAAPKIAPLKAPSPKAMTTPSKSAKPQKVEAAETVTPIRPVAPIRPPVLPTAAPIRSPIPDTSATNGGAASMVQGEETAYSYYIQIVNDKVNENWVTLGIDITGKRANPVVRFDIDRQGNVLNVRLDVPSGAPALDATAVTAVKTLALPPLPDEYPTELMRIRFTFDYEQNHH